MSNAVADGAALTLDGVTISVATERGRFDVVDALDLSLQPGTVTGLVGESGSGKTVTALAALGLLPEPTLRRERGDVVVSTGADGAVRLGGLGPRQLRELRGEHIAMVFQEPMTSLDPMFRVGDLVAEVLRAHREIGRRAARAEAVRLLAQVGIPDAERRSRDYPFQFSGGMRQRVLIAMAIACRPDVLIADEPTTALDVTVQAQILELLRSIAETGVAVLLVTHDLAVVAEFCDDVAVMYAGQLVESGPTHQVLAAPAHPYTAALLASVPSGDHDGGPLPTIEGRVPTPDAMPGGCRFAPRCEHATDACDEPIALVSFNGRRHRCERAAEIVLAGVR